MSPVRMSRIENVVRVVLAYKDAFNRKDIAEMMKLLSEDCEFESAKSPDGQKIEGKKEIELYWRKYFDEKSEIQMIGEDVNGLGIRCILRWRIKWKDTENKERHIRGVDIFEIEEGLISKQYSYVKG